MLDEKDRRILEVLEKNAQLTTREIAKQINQPITTIHNRIVRLRREGVIKHYTIIPDYEKVDRGFLVYVLIHVSLPRLKEKKRTQHDVAKEIKRFSFIERVDVVSGGSDLIAVIRVKGVKEFDKVLLTKLQQVEGIEKTQSLVVIHEG